MVTFIPNTGRITSYPKIFVNIPTINSLLPRITSGPLNYNLHEKDQINNYSITTSGFLDGLTSSGQLISGYTPTYSSLNSTIATVNQTGYISGISPGTALINIQAGADIKQVSFPVNFSGGLITETFLNYESGSVAYHIVTGTVNRASGTTTSVAGPMFSGYPVRNPAAWTKDVDLSCIALNTAPTGASFQGVLISPIHVLTAQHYFPAIGEQVTFVSATGGTSITKTAVAFMNGGQDTNIALLDSEIPMNSGFSYATIISASDITGKFPTDIQTYLFSNPPFSYSNYTFVNFPTQIPIFMTNQDYWNYIALPDAGVKPIIPQYNYLEMSTTLPSGLPPFLTQAINAGGTPARNGDSGWPVFYIINSKLVVLMCWNTAANGPFVTAFTSGINTAMSTLSSNAGLPTNYQLSYVNLSGFTSY